MSQNRVVILENKDGREMIQDLCNKSGINFDVFEELIDKEFEFSSDQKSADLWNIFDDILDRVCEGD